MHDYDFKVDYNKHTITKEVKRIFLTRDNRKLTGKDIKKLNPRDTDRVEFEIDDLTGEPVYIVIYRDRLETKAEYKSRIASEEARAKMHKEMRFGRFVVLGEEFIIDGKIVPPNPSKVSKAVIDKVFNLNK